MDFNFGGFAEIQEPSSGNSLKPWNIYNEVNFGGVSTKQSGTRKDGTPWNAWDFTFNAKEGSYSERIFEPLNDNDTEYNGKKIPSDFKRTQQFVVQVLSAYNPEGLEKLKEVTKSGKIKSFEQFIGLVSKLLEKPVKASENNNIQLKLLGRNSTAEDGSTRVYAKLTNCSYGSDGKPFMSKFIGKDLHMSSWEEQQAKKYASAVPSNPEKSNPVNNDIDSSSKKEIDDFESLL